MPRAGYKSTQSRTHNTNRDRVDRYCQWLTSLFYPLLPPPQKCLNSSFLTHGNLSLPSQPLLIDIRDFYKWEWLQNWLHVLKWIQDLKLWLNRVFWKICLCKKINQIHTISLLSHRNCLHLGAKQLQPVTNSAQKTTITKLENTCHRQ